MKRVTNLIYEDIIKQYMSIPCTDESRYSPLGISYCENNDFYSGYYWFYETDGFIIDINDFFIKQVQYHSGVNHSDFFQNEFLISNYIISGSGEWLNPYQTIEPFSMFIMDTSLASKPYLLHANARFFTVGIKFKSQMLEEYIQKNNSSSEEISAIFLETQYFVTQNISKIVHQILSFKKDGDEARAFFEAKAKEWLQITLEAYEEIKSSTPLTDEDNESIENVAKYIEDHYAFDIPQDLLERIATMGGTKLKESFKKKYYMSITEFTQRKRMNIAEHLLLTTDFDSQTIAKAIGYSSPSRFSALFKRYKGITPSEFKKQQVTI